MLVYKILKINYGPNQTSTKISFHLDVSFIFPKLDFYQKPMVAKSFFNDIRIIIYGT